VSFQPSSSPSLSTQPSSSPSALPSKVPSLSTQPSKEPSTSVMPSEVPSNIPSISTLPTQITEEPSQAPSISSAPTPGPTERRVFEEVFRSRDIGSVKMSNLAGQSSQSALGLYLVQGSGLGIWVGFDLPRLPCLCWLSTISFSLFAPFIFCLGRYG
jgi:hypothetical protein